MVYEIFFLITGLTLLYFGSEFLVKGASSTAMLFAVRPVIVGLTIVAFATSAPELLVSLFAAVEGSGGISVGNILGSNVINIALVLGISAIIKPIRINSQIIRFDLPYMLFASIVFLLLCLDGHIGFYDGLLLLFILLLFLVYGIINSRKKPGDNSDIQDKPPRSLKNISINILMIIIGIIALAKGADLVVQSAITMARSIGLSEVFIGISVVAFGTSLPELATSAVAASKGESDLSVGNVVGSNLFNICLVMGVVGLLNPMIIDKKLLEFEFPFMLAIAAIFYGTARLKKELNQITGAVFILFFVIYILISYLR